MNQRKLSLLLMLMLLANLIFGAAAYFSDSQKTHITARAASLKLGEITTIPRSLGDNLKPGDSGTFTVNFENKGTIPGEYTVKLDGIPDYLIFDTEEISGTVDSGDTAHAEFYWELPIDTDLGTGGQDIELQIFVNLDQIRP